MTTSRRLAVGGFLFALLAATPIGSWAKRAPQPAPPGDDPIAALQTALKPLLDGGQASFGSRGDEHLLTIPTTTLFLSGKETWTTEGRDLAAEIAAALAALPATSWRVEAHTDSSGSSGFNQRLTLLRAEQMKELLVAAGIQRSRVEALGRGEDQPAAPNDTPEGQAINRRLEILWR